MHNALLKASVVLFGINNFREMLLVAIYQPVASISGMFARSNLDQVTTQGPTEINIWALTQPLQNVPFTSYQPVLGSMFWVIDMLQVPGLLSLIIYR